MKQGYLPPLRKGDIVELSHGGCRHPFAVTDIGGRSMGIDNRATDYGSVELMPVDPEAIVADYAQSSGNP